MRIPHVVIAALRQSRWPAVPHHPSRVVVVVLDDVRVAGRRRPLQRRRERIGGAAAPVARGSHRRRRRRSPRGITAVHLIGDDRAREEGRRRPRSETGTSGALVEVSRVRHEPGAHWHRVARHPVVDDVMVPTILRVIAAATAVAGQGPVGHEGCWPAREVRGRRGRGRAISGSVHLGDRRQVGRWRGLPPRHGVVPHHATWRGRRPQRIGADHAGHPGVPIIALRMMTTMAVAVNFVMPSWVWWPIVVAAPHYCLEQPKQAHCFHSGIKTRAF